MNLIHEMTNHEPFGKHEKDCPYCKRAFKTNDSRVVYCSQKCKQRLAWKRRAEIGAPHVRREIKHDENGKYKRTCPVCGTEFRTNRAKTKYDTETCREKAMNKRFYKRHRRTIIQAVKEYRRKKKSEGE